MEGSHHDRLRAEDEDVGIGVTRWTDHDVCEALRKGEPIRDSQALLRAWERGLVDLRPTLTHHGAQLLDGIHPDAYEERAKYAGRRFQLKR